MLTRLTIMDLEPSRHRLFISMLFDLLFFNLLRGGLCCNRGRRRSQILAKFGLRGAENFLHGLSSCKLPIDLPCGSSFEAHTRCVDGRLSLWVSNVVEGLTTIALELFHAEQLRIHRFFRVSLNSPDVKRYMVP